MNIDFDQINRIAMTRIRTLLESWCPGGRYEGTEYVPLNPTRDDKNPGSFKINTESGKWIDFATDDQGGDIISLYAYLRGLSQGEAAMALAKDLGVELESSPRKRVNNSPKRVNLTAVIPIPESAFSSVNRCGSLGTPTHIWTYYDANGQPLFLVYRFDRPDGSKDIRPRSFWSDGYGNAGLHWKGLPAPRPLYGLELLAKAGATTPILLAEGEKAADAARKIVGDNMVVMTWPNGSKAVHKADWSPLKVRELIIWPDADKPGFEAALKVAEFAVIEQAASVSIVSPPEDVPEGWDLADATDWDCQRTLEWIEANKMDRDVFKRLALDRYGIDGKPEASKATSGGFLLKEDGVYYTSMTRDGDLVEDWVCSPLEVIAATRDADNQNWGRLVSVTDLDGKKHPWAMPMEMTAGSGEPFRQNLANLGLRLAPGSKAKNLLLQYITQTDPKTRARCVARTGWHGETFVLHDQTYGKQDEEQVILQGLFKENPYKQRGSLQEWKDSVGALCVGNSRLVFAVSAAFGAVMQHPAGAESGGFHLIGNSSIGKTTILQAAASVCGGGGDVGYIRPWRSTDNGIEAIAASFCDTLVCLDEMGQASSNVVAEAAYLMANEMGKMRANKTGGSAHINSWRSTFLSTGETSLRDKLLEDSRAKIRGGQAVRILDIPADAGRGFGAFEDLHGLNSGEEFARAISQAANAIYGTPLHAFLENITSDIATNRTRHAQLRDRFYDTHCPTDADGQVQRAFRRFAHVAASGELAAELGILPWKPAEASKATLTCFHAWLDHRGGKGAAEEREALRQIRAFFEKYGRSRFELIPPKHAENLEVANAIAVHNRAGFRSKDELEGSEFLVFPEAFREICQGFELKMVCRMLVRRGILITQAPGSKQMNKKLPGIGQKKVYVINSKIFEE